MNRWPMRLDVAINEVGCGAFVKSLEDDGRLGILIDWIGIAPKPVIIIYSKHFFTKDDDLDCLDEEDGWIEKEDVFDKEDYEVIVIEDNTKWLALTSGYDYLLDD